ncbi:CBS domain-containing protein [Desulfoluna spongiiphila]|uniref:Acetoin utilization protein AcuB n=1 Tax=Desulfoluna spongiiphila TaxID=419481 RepID=A0A1G5I1N6_9BACT|nr:CBS domain-containing protein [Desulfoluna spongiiphila]SCY69932.1 acetoin utilization protein AcuB [Desulfoluna spongiiphila]VVS92639.1 cbs domain [Desulfoluna spongiiphila]
MNITKIMSKRIVTVELDDTLRVVRDIFTNVAFHNLLVVDNKRLYGILSDRDLLKALSPNLGTAAETREDRATLNKKVHQIMSREPITLTEEAGVRDAIDLFNTETITCIPVVDNENRPVGIISWRDIIKMLANIIEEKSKKSHCPHADL